MFTSAIVKAIAAFGRLAVRIDPVEIKRSSYGDLADCFAIAGHARAEALRVLEAADANLALLAEAMEARIKGTLEQRREAVAWIETEGTQAAISGTSSSARVH